MSALYSIDIIRTTRKHFLQLIGKCSLEQINRIPEGFNNNLAWHLAHILSSQQMLCYELSGLVPPVDMMLIDAFRPGTFPGLPMDEAALNNVKDLIVSTADQLEQDYKSGLFKTYIQRQTKYGVLIENIDHAIPYAALHEGIHFGYSKALYTLINQQK